MDRVTLGYWTIIAIYLIVTGIPTARILARTGYSRWWTLLYFIPLVSVVALWVLAYRRWPSVDRV
jgi:hypothetical protein